MAKVAVIMGSKSDYPSLEKAVKILKAYGAEVTVRVMSAHRTPDAAAQFAATAEGNGYEVLIAGAGKAAHLAGALAARTVLPIIGVPMKSSTLDGMDALLSTVQMPGGIPVATVAIDGAENAALLALQILALKYPDIRQKLKDARTDMEASVESADEEVQALAARL